MKQRREVDSNARSPRKIGRFHGSVKVPIPTQGPRSRRTSHGRGDRLPSAGSDRRAPHTPTGPNHQKAAGAVDPPQAWWKTRVLTSMLSRGSTSGEAVGSSKAECAVKRAVPSSTES